MTAIVEWGGALEPVPERAVDADPRGDIAPPGQELAEPSDTSFEVVLDEDNGPLVPVPVDVPIEVDKRPIIPVHLRTRQGVANTLKRTAKQTGHRVAVHAVRTPMYVPQGLFWSVVGVFKLVGRQLRWWWHPELSSLLQHTASKNDSKEGREVHKHLSKARRVRAYALAAELVGLVVAVVLLLALTPRWVQLVVVLLLVPFLAHLGRPSDRPIISPAMTTPLIRRLNSDIVLNAYYAAGLGHPEKPDQQVQFGTRMSRDRYDTGSQVGVILPYGTTFTEAMNAREKLASALDVSISQVYLTRDKKSERRHTLFVADVDPLAVKAGRSPLLDCKPRDIWRPAPLGLDERGQRVLLPLMWTSVLIGAQPRKGKTFTARSLALFAALDPYVRISVFDGKGSPDWRKFFLIAYTYGFGLLPDRIQGDPIENLRATLRDAKREILERNARLSELPTSVCPEGKLTREIARDPRFGMPVWVLLLDEFQEYLNTGDEEADREIAELLVSIIKVGPSVGVIIISSTQRPSGIGSTGKVAKLFTDFRDNHLTRFALKTASYKVSNMVLGDTAYSEGYDSSSLPVGDGSEGTYDYRGIGILYDSPVGNATVRTYLADGQDAEKILMAARKLRERTGTLEGMAAGLEVAKQPRDVLVDVLDAFLAGETFLSWETLSARLAEQLPERYAQEQPDALSKTLRSLGLGIESKAGAEKGRPNERPRGVYLAQLRRAWEQRSGKEAA